MYIANPTQIPPGVFIYTLHPTRIAMLTDGPTDEERALAGSHWVYSQDLLARNIVIFAGRTTERTEASYAFCVIQTSSEEEARKIMEEDPAVKGGVFHAKLFAFQPMLIGEWKPFA
jgi:uncharacterized protein